MNHRLDDSEKKERTCSLSEEPSLYMTELKQRLSDLIEAEEGGHIKYREGAIGDALYKDKDVAIQMMMLKKGDRFPEHQHPVEKEWLIIISGSAAVKMGDKEEIFGPQDHIVIMPGQSHSGQALEDLWHVAISIPADEGYPDVPTS